jgi:hypothetical protein
MSLTFACIDLSQVTYQVSLESELLDPVPVDEVQRVYRAYCAYKKFHSVMPMIPGRFLVPGTEVWGYQDHNQLVAWSMYRVWDAHSVVCDHHAWDYQNPQLQLGIRSFKNECAIYRDRGFKFMYFESVASYMFDIEGFKILGPLE